jgi:hypothetical protein
MKSDSSVKPLSSFVRSLTLTPPSRSSLSPTTSMYGTFWSWASRTFAFILSERSSTSTRNPAYSSLTLRA